MNKMGIILINSLGIQDSGGITVFDKLLYEIAKSKYKFLIVCNQNTNILNLIQKYSEIENFEFLIIPSKGFIYRLYIENIVFRKIIKEKKIDLVYNFSGTSQFFSKVVQMTKVHNLLFYSKKIDKVYFEKKEYFKWTKQIFLKRIIFHTMLRQTKYIEVQSNHVKENISDFINISNKQFFIKSDIDVSDNLFLKPKNYDFIKRIKFLYIVGPHFEYLHKNFEDFVNTMIEVNKKNIDFQIILTLSKNQLYTSNLWDKSLDDKTSYLGYISKEELLKEFQDNTILISTSVIETLGLHVIEAVQNGILAIVPNEKYSLNVYGNNILTYELFNSQSLIKTIKNITLLSNNDIKDIIQKNQKYLIKNESTKNQNIVNIFDEILKDENVQK